MSQPTGERPQPALSGAAVGAGMNEGMRVLSYLISGVLLYGVLGWLGDRFFDTSFLLPIGIVLGAGFGVYVIIRRFGTSDDGSAASSKAPGTTNTTEGTT